MAEGGWATAYLIQPQLHQTSVHCCGLLKGLAAYLCTGFVLRELHHLDSDHQFKTFTLVLHGLRTLSILPQDHGMHLNSNPTTTIAERLEENQGCRRKSEALQEGLFEGCRRMCGVSEKDCRTCRRNVEVCERVVVRVVGGLRKGCKRATGGLREGRTVAPSCSRVAELKKGRVVARGAAGTKRYAARIVAHDTKSGIAQLGRDGGCIRPCAQTTCASRGGSAMVAQGLPCSDTLQRT